MDWKLPIKIQNQSLMGASRMKKYWKIIVVLIITVITVGTYYIRSSFASRTVPEFEVKK